MTWQNVVTSHQRSFVFIMIDRFEMAIFDVLVHIRKIQMEEKL